MKKFLAIFMTLSLLLAFVACSQTENTEPTEAEQKIAETEVAVDETTNDDEPEATEETADNIADTMTSEDGKYEVAFVSDIGQLKDKSFNQGIYDGVKFFAYNNGLSYMYYQPANDSNATDDDRYNAMAQACDNGAKVVVCAGYLQETALRKAAVTYPEVKFVFIDGYPLTDDAGNALTNVAGLAFKEEQCGYFAGYAVVKEGMTELGFCGVGTDPACCRYGYGFIQGANAAAAELDKYVKVNYSWLYGSDFSTSAELQILAERWYTNGTEVIFACDNSVFEPIAVAAAANNTAVIGVDFDRSNNFEAVITSAVKGLDDAAVWAIEKVYDGTWNEIGGMSTSLGAADKATGLTTDTWTMTGYTVEEYEALLAAVIAGDVVIDDNYDANLIQEYSNLTLNIVE